MKKKKRKTRVIFFIMHFEKQVEMLRKMSVRTDILPRHPSKHATDVMK